MKAKEHHGELEEAGGCLESSVGAAGRYQGYLLVALAEAQGGDESGSANPLQKIIDPGHGVSIKLQHRVELPELYADAE